MKQGLTLLASVILMVSTGAAHAERLNGKIRNIDIEANQFQLKNGLTFHYGGDIEDSQLVKGARVKVNYKSKDGQLIVRRLYVISTPQD